VRYRFKYIFLNTVFYCLRSFLLFKSLCVTVLNTFTLQFQIHYRVQKKFIVVFKPKTEPSIQSLSHPLYYQKKVIVYITIRHREYRKNLYHTFVLSIPFVLFKRLIYIPS